MAEYFIRVWNILGRLDIHKTAVFVYLFILFADPFSLHSLTSDVSNTLSYRLHSVFAYPQKAQSHITAVLIDDQSALQEGGYPLQMENHAEILSEILCQGPAALFIDLSFRSVRMNPDADVYLGEDGKDGVDVLKAALQQKPGLDCTLTAKGSFSPNPKVFLARVRTPSGECDPFFPETDLNGCGDARRLNTLTASPTIETTSIAPVTDYYPVVISNKDTYRAFDSTQEPSSWAEAAPSPALATVLALCDLPHTRDLRGCQDRQHLASLVRLKDEDSLKHQALLWPYYVSPNMAQKYKDQGIPCGAGLQYGQESIFQKLVVNEIYPSIFQSVETGKPRMFGGELCLPYDNLTIGQVRQASSHCGTADECQERMSSFFSGRIVFYGADITAINDRFDSPVLGSIPGALLHAVAADNLLVYGKNYTHRPDVLYSGWITLYWSQLYELGTILLTFALFIAFLAYVMNDAYDDLSGSRKWLLRIALFLIWLSVTGISSTFAFLVFNWPAVDIIGLGAAVTTISYLTGLKSNLYDRSGSM